MNLYDELNKLESLNSNIDKENQLKDMINRIPEAEAFFRFAFSDIKYGVQEKTFKNIYGVHTFNHISDYLGSTECDKLTSDEMIVKDLINFGDILLNNSGSAQQEQIQKFFYLLSAKKRKWFCRAILKDLRCGVQVKTINRVFKSLGIKEIKKFSLQLCDKVDIYSDNDVKKKLYFPLSMECKYDGIRIQAEISSPDEKTTFVQLTSRRGKDRTDSYPEICEALADKFAGENIILDGEVISSSFQELTRKDSIAQKKYVIFDLIVDEGLKYGARWDNLLNLLIDKGITDLNNKKNIKYNNKILVAAEHYSANNIDDIRAYYEDLNSRKEEGIIIKLDDRPYERNSRKHMFKCKKVYTADLLCVGYELGEGRRTGKVSTLCLEDKSGTIKVDVGSGIDDVTCERLTSEMLEHKECGLDALSNPWEGMIVEILYNEITETGSIRFPRFIRIRDDKDEPDDLSNEEVRQ